MWNVQVRSYAPVIREQTKKTGVTKCNTKEVKRDFEGDWTFTAFGPAIWAGQGFCGIDGSQGQSLAGASVYTQKHLSHMLGGAMRRFMLVAVRGK
jgi:hypothetical protein